MWCVYVQQVHMHLPWRTPVRLCGTPQDVCVAQLACCVYPSSAGQHDVATDRIPGECIPSFLWSDSFALPTVRCLQLVTAGGLDERKAYLTILLSRNPLLKPA